MGTIVAGPPLESGTESASTAAAAAGGTPATTAAAGAAAEAPSSAGNGNEASAASTSTAPGAPQSSLPSLGSAKRHGEEVPLSTAADVKVKKMKLLHYKYLLPLLLVIFFATLELEGSVNYCTLLG